MLLYKSVIFLSLLFISSSLVFVFQIIPLFVPETSTNFMPYIVQIISICLSWILQPLEFSLLPLIWKFWEHFIKPWFMLFQLISLWDLCGWRFYILSNTFWSPVDTHIITVVVIIGFQSHKPSSNFNLILFFDFHIIWLPEIRSLHIKVSHSLFTYWQSLSDFCNHQIMISIIVNSSNKRSGIKYTWILSFIYQDIISLVVVSHQGKSKCVYEFSDSYVFFFILIWKVYYSNPIIITNFMQAAVIPNWKYLPSLFQHWNIPTKCSCDISNLIKLHAVFSCKSYLCIITFIVIPCIFRKVMSHQGPLIVIYDILSLITATLITADLILLGMKKPAP